jgi:hypothetical protein
LGSFDVCVSRPRCKSKTGPGGRGDSPWCRRATPWRVGRGAGGPTCRFERQSAPMEDACREDGVHRLLRGNAVRARISAVMQAASCELRQLEESKKKGAAQATPFRSPPDRSRSFNPRAAKPRPSPGFYRTGVFGVLLTAWRSRQIAGVCPVGNTGETRLNGHVGGRRNAEREASFTHCQLCSETRPG